MRSEFKCFGDVEDKVHVSRLLKIWARDERKSHLLVPLNFSKYSFHVHERSQPGLPPYGIAMILLEKKLGFGCRTSIALYLTDFLRSSLWRECLP